jgi:hypothetical protein
MPLRGAPRSMKVCIPLRMGAGVSVFDHNEPTPGAASGSTPSMGGDF